MSARILEGPKLNTSVPKISLGRMFFDSGTKFSNKICQVDGTTDQTETYGSVKQRSTRVAIELQRRGITSKDVIAFCTRNTIDSVIPIIATFYLGAKVANLEPSLSVRHTKHLISLTKPKIIFVESEAIALIEECSKDVDFKVEIIVYGESTKYKSLANLTKEVDGEDSFKPAEVDIDDIALMFFSSGTTGLPKAICHSHFSFLYICYCLYEYGLGKAIMHFTTFYWGTAMCMLVTAYLGGGYRVFCHTPDPEITFKTIEKYKVDGTFLAPILTYNLTNFEKAKNYDTTSLRLIQCGGTPIKTSQLQKMAKLFKHSYVTRCYGMSEAGFVCAFYPETDEELMKIKTEACGRILYDIKLKIVDEISGKPLGPNQKGEILIKAPYLMKGYYNEDSSSVFDSDGFLKTGDIGYYDEDECLYVIGRIKEMFKYQSWHIVPSAIEGVLLEHPAVKEAVVFGVPFGEEGEAPGACIVLRSTVSREEIEKFVAEKVSDREKLRGGVFFADSLPKTPTGKVIRQEVKKMFCN